jgi:hypothetical protein
MENEQSKQKFPIGMILILIITGGASLGLLFDIFDAPMSQLGPILFSGTGAVIIKLIKIGILTTIFYGIIKRLKWAKKLAISWYAFAITLLLINLISLLTNKTLYDNYYQKIASPETLELMTPKVMIAGTIPGLIILFIIIIYLARKKDFFVN